MASLFGKIPDPFSSFFTCFLFFPNSVNLGSSAKVKIPEQVGAAKIPLRKVLRFPGRGSQARFPSIPRKRFPSKVPKQGSQARFQSKVPKQGSQARFPSKVPRKRFPSKVPRKRFPSKVRRKRFPSKVPRKRFPSKVPKQGSQARFPGRGYQTFPSKVPNQVLNQGSQVSQEQVPQIPKSS